MNRFIEFIKRIFFKRMPVLEEPKAIKDEQYFNQKENFLNSIKVENTEDNVFLIQKQIENGLIDESNLSEEQLIKIKDLYCNQILDLVASIKNTK